MNMKAAASLTGSLLARKGAAYPAAYSAPSTTPNTAGTEASEHGQPQRAYNDPRVIASAPPQPAPQPAPPATPGPQFQDGRFESEPAKAAITEQPAPPPADDTQDGLSLPQVMDKMGRVRLSVRLDPDRYLRVKMASARTRWSAQDIVIAALDRYLNGSSGSSGSVAGDAADSEDDDGSVN